ncbi:MAG: MFS transporter [Spirochaetes bacterium]|nr:MFS transporter [Spirochaetota bacterium]
MNSSTGRSTDAEKLGVLNKLGYGIGDFAANITFQSVTLFLLYFFTDVFMIGAASAGVIFFIAKLWNAACDPSMGYVADRTRTRWGRNRPFLLFGALPLGLAYFLLFASPDLSPAAKTAYALVTFLAFSTCYSVINIPYGALTANLTLDTNERSSLTGFRMAFAILGTLLVAGATKPIVALFPDQTVGFRMIGIIYGSLCVAVNIITFSAVRERVMPPKEQGMSFRQDLKLVAGNRPFIILTVSTILQMMAINLLAAMINYYFKYNLRAESYIPVAFLCLFATAMVALPLWVFVSGKWGKKTSFICGMTLLSFVLLGLRFIPAGNIVPVLGLFVVAGIGMATQYLCPWSMIPDTVEYAQLKTGLRREGILYGFFNFAFKFSAAFSGILAGFGLDFFGYVPNVAQHQRALDGIGLMMTVLPFVLIIAGVALIFFYPIDAAAHARIVAELEAKQ